MTNVIWGTWIVGVLVAGYFFGYRGALVFVFAWGIVTRVFRRQLVIALTKVAMATGLSKETLARLPSAIHLQPLELKNASTSDAVVALCALGFLEVGGFQIAELPKVGLTLLVHPSESMVAAVESAGALYSQVNLHTLYPSGQCVTFTNSPFKGRATAPPDITRVWLPRTAPRELFERARADRPPAPFERVTAEAAPSIYAALYARWTAHQKERAA